MREITVYSEESKKKDRKYLVALLRTVGRELAKLGRKSPETEVLPTLEVLCHQAETLNVLIHQEGETMTKLGKDVFCRVFLNPHNGSLEIRIGTKRQVRSESFYGIKGLQMLVQIAFGFDGKIHQAVLGNLVAQDETMIGSGEYDTFGNVDGLTYYKIVGAVGTFTEDGPQTIRVPQEAKDNILFKILEPVKDVLEKQTRGRASVRLVRTLSREIRVEKSSENPLLESSK